MPGPLRSPPYALLLSLALVAVLTAGCGNNDTNPAAPGGSGSPDVIINIVANNGSNSFSPNPDTVSVGQTVAWRNQHSQTHTATADNGTTFNTGNIAAGSTSAAITMTTAGSYPYHCGLHPSMIATLVVKP